MEKTFYNNIIKNNKSWVEDKLKLEPDYFTKLENSQHPSIFWIGCADSCVPANEIIGANPGEVFVHRNIANMVLHTDMSMLSVLDYAVNQLKIRHIIVCGHYGCGGVKAAMGNQPLGLIDNWIRHIKDVYRFHSVELDSIRNEETRYKRFVELNVIEQVNDLAKTSIVQEAWKKDQPLSIHGWVYGVGSGVIKDLDVNFSNDDDLGSVYKLSFE